MKNKLAALITAGAIATAGLSAPVQASPADDMAKLLFGAVVIGAIINSTNSPRRAPVTRRVVDPYPVVVVRHHHHAKPELCLRQRYTYNGWVTYYGKNCMRNNGWYLRNGNWRINAHDHW